MTALRLAVVVASVRPERVGEAVARWFCAQVGEGFDIDVVDLATLVLPDALDGGGDTDVLAKRIDVADAIVLVTPEYNRGYPGVLKTAIDSLTTPWHAKPVGFVAYGGVSGGLRAVEQLRPVLAELHAVTLQATVSLPYAWDLPVVDGAVVPTRGASAVRELARQLTWWGSVLRDARPYDP